MFSYERARTHVEFRTSQSRRIEETNSKNTLNLFARKPICQSTKMRILLTKKRC
jgi:hypothetical protein